MRKTALVLAALMAVTAPSLAYAKKAKKKMAAPAPAAFKPAPAVDNSKFFKDGFSQFFVPAQQIGGKMGMMMPAAEPAKPMMKKKGKKKKMKKKM